MSVLCSPESNSSVRFWGTGHWSLYHYCCLLGNSAPGQWGTWTVGKDLDVLYCAGEFLPYVTGMAGREHDARNALLCSQLYHWLSTALCLLSEHSSQVLQPISHPWETEADTPGDTHSTSLVQCFKELPFGFGVKMTLTLTHEFFHVLAQRARHCSKGRKFLE